MIISDGHLFSGRTHLRRLARLGIVVAAGACLVLALPPCSILPLAFVAFVALARALRGASALGAFWLGYMFGLGQFAPGLFWITESFEVEADRFGWLALPAVFGLAGLLSAFPALACAIAARVARSGLPPALSLATAWAASEWLRGHVVTGFPWNLAAYTLADWTVPSQAASVVGSYGLGFLLVLCASLAALAFGRADRHLRMLRLTGATAILLSVAGFGVVRLATSDPASDGGTQVRVVQPNIAQNAKWDNTSRKADILRLFSLSARPGSFDLLFGPKPPGLGSMQRIVAHGSRWGGCCPKRVSCSPAARSGKKPRRGRSTAIPSSPSLQTAQSSHVTPSITSCPLASMFPGAVCCRFSGWFNLWAILRQALDRARWRLGPTPALEWRYDMRQSFPAMSPMTRSVRTGSSTQPTMPGSAPRSDHRNIWLQPECERSKKAFRLFVPPTPEFPLWSTPTVGRWLCSNLERQQ